MKTPQDKYESNNIVFLNHHLRSSFKSSFKITFSNEQKNRRGINCRNWEGLFQRLPFKLHLISDQLVSDKQLLRWLHGFSGQSDV